MYLVGQQTLLLQTEGVCSVQLQQQSSRSHISLTNCKTIIKRYIQARFRRSKKAKWMSFVTKAECNIFSLWGMLGLLIKTFQHSYPLQGLKGHSDEYWHFKHLKKKMQSRAPFSSASTVRVPCAEALQRTRVRLLSPASYLSLPVSCHIFSCSINKAIKSPKKYLRKKKMQSNPSIV